MWAEVDDDDHTGDGGTRCQHPIPAFIAPFMDYADLRRYPGAVDLDDPGSMDGIINGYDTEWYIKAAAQNLATYLAGTVVQKIPMWLRQRMMHNGFRPRNSYKYWTSANSSHAAGQSVEHPSPAARALQEFLDGFCQHVNPRYSSCGYPMGKGGKNRRYACTA
jgi:hypothetical protein